MIASLIVVGWLVAAAPAPASQVAAKPAASGPRRVAVAELEAGYRADPRLTRTLSVLLTSELRRRPALSVISQDDIRTLLGIERQRQLLRCGSVSCLTEIAGALGAASFVAGSFSQVGDRFVLVVRVIDTARARVLREVTRRIPVTSQDTLPQVVADLASDLFPDAPLPAVPEEALEAPAVERPSVVPPLVLGITGVVAAAVGAGLGLDAMTSSASGLTYGQAVGKNREATTGLVLVSAGAVAGVAGLIWGLVR